MKSWFLSLNGGLRTSERSSHLASSFFFCYSKTRWSTLSSEHPLIPPAEVCALVINVSRIWTILIGSSCGSTQLFRLCWTEETVCYGQTSTDGGRYVNQIRISGNQGWGRRVSLITHSPIQEEEKKKKIGRLLYFFFLLFFYYFLCQIKHTT